MKKRWVVIGCVLTGLTFFSFSPAGDRLFEIARNLDLFASVFREVNENYVDDINPNKLAKTGIDAMLGSLDPYTNYIPEDEVENFRTMNTGQYGGIGAVTRQVNGRIVVTMLYEGFAAIRGGLRIGDEVMRIDSVDLSKITLDETNHLMRGQLGTPVSLTVKRVGSPKPIRLTFKREKIKVSNVPFSGFVAPGVGYIQLADFTPDAAKEVQNALSNLKEKGAKSLVLDLRGNPGGLLLEAVHICNLFLPKGKLVVTTRGKTDELKYETQNMHHDLDIPLAVLINRGSASASEIVAGTLQDYDRAVIIGEKSFGKGLVQVSRLLSYNSQLKVTTAKYYTPSGRCIQVLDYSHRREDGSVGTVPDSIKRPFKTSKGRTVYDGGGIDPDVAVKSIEPATITEVLERHEYLFDYATIYASQHPTIAGPETFQLTDKDYNDFASWVRDRLKDYRTDVEQHLDNVLERAKQERFYNDLKTPAEQLYQRLKEEKREDLVTFRDEIRRLLEIEIISRYYYERGQTQIALRHDEVIQKTTELLANVPAYKKILNIK